MKASDYPHDDQFKIVAAIIASGAAATLPPAKDETDALERMIRLYSEACDLLRVQKEPSNRGMEMDLT